MKHELDVLARIKAHKDMWSACKAYDNANELRLLHNVIEELIDAANDVERRAGPDREPRLRAALAKVQIP